MKENDKNGENVSVLKITYVVQVHCDLGITHINRTQEFYILLHQINH